MDYELAKQLKNAGFPFDWIEYDIDGINQITKPTLSQLIEACGDDFAELVRINYPKGNIFYQAYPTDEWFDKSKNDCVRDCCGYETGDTPEEAVARLWLELHK